MLIPVGVKSKRPLPFVGRKGPPQCIDNLLVGLYWQGPDIDAIGRDAEPIRRKGRIGRRCGIIHVTFPDAWRVPRTSTEVYRAPDCSSRQPGQQRLCGQGTMTSTWLENALC